MTWIEALPETIKADFFAALKHRDFVKGDYIYRRGEEAGHCYYIFNGHVQLKTTSVDGKQVIITVVHGGELLGEVASIDGGRRAYDAIATEAGIVGSITAQAFNMLRHKHATFNDAITTQLIRHIRDTVLLINQTALWSLEKRVVSTLLQNLVPPSDNLGFFNVSLSQEDISYSLGVSRQSIHRVVKLLNTNGLIKLEKRKINVSDVSALKVYFKDIN